MEPTVTLTCGLSRHLCRKNSPHSPCIALGERTRGKKEPLDVVFTVRHLIRNLSLIQNASCVNSG